ncbi:MAG: methionine--tRNA ligase, partial [Planctomycetota bacterium]
MSRRFLVTAALPYANNRLHLGHIAGAYLPADIYVRYLRMAGEDVVFVCGSDDHGVPTTITAQQDGCTPQEVVSRYRAMQEKAFAGLRIEFDIFSGTSISPRHEEFSQEFFRVNFEKGHIVPRDTEQFYCASCDRYLPDRYVEGRCPHCHSAGARGDQCEACGRFIEQTQLVDPYCAVCRSAPELRRTRHWFFQLDHFADGLLEWLDGREGWRENVHNFARAWVKDGLPERSITRDLSWGVPVPLEEARGKVLYVWFDAPIGYLSFTQELFERRGDPEGWRRYWQDPEARLVHFIGKDNIVFHAVIWPAMLMGRGELNLPWNIPANEFLNLKGEKFSKSKRHAVWADEILEEHPADRIRYYLTAIAPEGRDTSFTFEDFTKRNNEELSDVVGNLCHRVFTFSGRYFDNKVPEGVAADAAGAKILARIGESRDAWRNALEGCRIKEALGIAVNLAREG